MWVEITNELNNILSSNSDLAVVYDYETPDINKEPAAVIVPSNNQSSYSSTSQNDRIYGFTIKLYIGRDNTNVNKPKKNADRIMRKLTDSVMDDLDKNYNLPNVTEPTGYTFINLFAVPSRWGYSGRELEYRVAEIELEAKTKVDVTLIN